MTIREALAEAGTVLAAGGIENPGLDASLLLATVLHISRSSLIAASSEPLAEPSRATFNDLIRRRLAGECAAYILGRKEFYGLELQVNPAVLVPRPETELLVETALRIAEGKGLRVLDLCTGSGAVAIALKHQMPEWDVWATDISAAALETAQTNAARLLPPDSITFRQGNLYEALPSPNYPLPTTHYSLVLSNPPYIPTAEIPGLSPEVRMEPLLALDGGRDGLDLIKTIISRAPGFLCPGGALLLEADPRQMEAITTLLKQADFSNIGICRDLSGSERVIFAFAGVF